MTKSLCQIITAAALTALLHSPSYGQSDKASTASALMAFGASTLVEGSAELLAAGPSLLIESVQRVGDNVLLVAGHGAHSAKISLNLSAAAAGDASLAVGKTMTVTSTAAGLLLSSAGQLIGWLPNAIGRELIYEQALSDR